MSPRTPARWGWAGGLFGVVIGLSSRGDAPLVMVPIVALCLAWLAYNGALGVYEGEQRRGGADARRLMDVSGAPGSDSEQ